MLSKDKLHISSLPFAIFLIYVIGIWLCDFFDVVCYLIGIPQVTIISRVLVIVFVTGLILVVRKKTEIGKMKKNTFFYLAIIFILVFGFVKAIIPDTSYDVQSYHLLAQNPGFTNYFAVNAAPGDFQLFVFLLPDRLFYHFRLFLGYRMGTLLNSLAMVLVYLQIVRLLTMLCGKGISNIQARLRKSNKFGFVSGVLSESFLAFIIAFFHDVVLQTASYMVEIVAIPIALEALGLLLRDKEEIGKKDVLYFALLNGLFFCMKMTNIVYILPILILFIIKNRKKMSILLVSFCGLLCALPVSIYLFYNFISTGNPVFPYFNTIFKSVYFNLINFKDERWGPTNLKQLIFWPLYMIFKPGYRQSEFQNSWPFALICGFGAVLYFVTLEIRNKFKLYKNELVLICIFIPSLYLWAMSTGHIRYFMFGNMIGGLLCVSFLISVMQIRHIYNSLFSVLCIGVLTMQPVMAFYNDAKGIEWSWRALSLENYKENLKFVFNDYQNYAAQEQSKKIDLFVFNKYAMGSIAQLINPKSPIIYLYYVNNRIEDKELQSKYQNMINSYLSQDKNAYDIGRQSYSEVEQYLKSITENGFYIEQVEYLDGSFVDQNALLLYKLGNLEKGKTNSINYANLSGQDSVTFNINGENAVLKASVGLTEQRGWLNVPLYFNIVASDGKSTKTVLEYPVSEGEFININEKLNFKGLSGNITLKFILTDQNGNQLNNIEPYRLAVINPQVVAISSNLEGGL